MVAVCCAHCRCVEEEETLRPSPLTGGRKAEKGGKHITKAAPPMSPRVASLSLPDHCMALGRRSPWEGETRQSVNLGRGWDHETASGLERGVLLRGGKTFQSAKGGGPLSNGLFLAHEPNLRHLPLVVIPVDGEKGWRTGGRPTISWVTLATPNILQVRVNKYKISC